MGARVEGLASRVESHCAIDTVASREWLVASKFSYFRSSRWKRVNLPSVLRLFFHTARCIAGWICKFHFSTTIERLGGREKEQAKVGPQSERVGTNESFLTNC